ncbi:MAG: hypothetical protein HOP27_09370 [Anaerolineales bacterium]|nr:hypothetical protein [Anaerolineales bacterium]
MTKRKTTKTSTEELDVLEAHLAGTLQPVAPSKEIVQRLRVRIQMPNREEIVSRLGDWYRLFFVFGGVISGMMLLLTVARAFYYLTGRKG